MFILFQDVNVDYNQVLYNEVFMSNIRKFISANKQEGSEGSSKELGYIRVSTSFRIHLFK